jgi:hypothetical protein
MRNKQQMGRGCKNPKLPLTFETCTQFRASFLTNMIKFSNTMFDIPSSKP